MTEEIKNFVTPGQVLKLKTSSKSAIRVLKKGGQKEELLDNVFVIKKGNDVVLKYSDGVEVVLQDYVSECRKDDECVLTVPTKEGGQFTLSGADFDLPTYQDDLLLYAHGDKATLAEMAGQNSQWSQIVSSIDNPEITYLYTDGGSNNAYFIGGIAAGLAALAGGVAAAGGSGKSGGSSSSNPPPAPDTSVKTGGVAITGISTDTGSSTSDFVTNDQTLEFHGTLGSALASGEKVQVSLDGGATWHDAVTTGTTWSFDNTANVLADGTYNVVTRVSNGYGKSSVVATQAVIIDTAGPSASTTIAITGITTDTGLSASDYITNDQSLIFRGALGASLASDEKVQVSLDGGVYWHDAIMTGTAWSYDNTVNTMAAGTYNVVTRMVDVAGNVGQSAAQTVVIDTTRPSAGHTVSITSYTDAVALYTGDFGSGTTTNDPSPVLHGAVTGLTSGEFVIIYEVSGLAVGVATVSGNGWSLALNGLADGTHTYFAGLQDSAGNLGTASSIFKITEDKTPPADSIAISGLSTGTGSSASHIMSNDQSLELLGTLDSTLIPDEKAQVRLDGSSAWRDVVTTGTAWSFDNTPLMKDSVDDPLPRNEVVQISLGNGTTWADATTSGMTWNYDEIGMLRISALADGVL